MQAIKTGVCNFSMTRDKIIHFKPGRHYQTAAGRKYLVLSSVSTASAVPHCVTDHSLPVAVADAYDPRLGHQGTGAVLSPNSLKKEKEIMHIKFKNCQECLHIWNQDIEKVLQKLKISDTTRSYAGRNWLSHPLHGQ